MLVDESRSLGKNSPDGESGKAEHTSQDGYPISASQKTCFEIDLSADRRRDILIVQINGCNNHMIVVAVFYFVQKRGKCDMGKWIALCSMLLLFVIIFAMNQVGHRHGNGLHKHHRGFRHKHHRGARHKHGAWISIDYFAYSSKIRHWNPTFKVILSVLTIILCIVLKNVYVSIAVIISMAYLVIEVGGLSLHDYISVLTVPLTFIVVSILAIVVDFARQPASGYHLYIGFGYLYTTMAMLKGGIAIMLKIIAAVSALQMMILTTPSFEVISVMKKLHLPKDFITLTNMIYRYIFILLDILAKMKDAAESRLGYRDFRTSCYTFGNVASNLLVLSLKKAGAYYDAMEARCFDGELMFLEEDKKFEIKVIIPAAVFILYLIMLWYLTR